MIIIQFQHLARVRNDKTNKMLKPRNDGHGYHYVGLCKNGKVKPHKVRRLVALAFIANPKDKPTVDHIDDDRTNNHIIIFVLIIECV